MARPRPSLTAQKVARFMLLLDAQPRLARLLPTGAAAVMEGILRASGAMPAGLIDMMRRPSMQRFARVMEALTGRGQLLWFGVRKRFMADAALAAIADGATQLLVVGAGFDPLAALVAREHPHVTCIEIDMPATAEPKRRGLDGSGARRDNLHVVGVDLSRHSLADALRSSPWRAGARSVIVAEGLLMYLDQAAVRQFLAAVAELAGPGSRLVFSCMQGDERQNARIPVAIDWLIRASLRLAGEPLLWGIARPRLAAFLAELGYQVVDLPDTDALRERYLAPIGVPDEPLMPYEFLAVAAL